MELITIVMSIVLLLLPWAIAIAAGIFWIIMLVHIVSKPVKNKFLWVFLLVFTGIVGALIYYFVVKRKFNKQVPLPSSSQVQ